MRRRISLIFPTNHHQRDVIGGFRLTPAIREDFSYIDWPAVKRGDASAGFARYQGELIDLNEVHHQGWIRRRYHSMEEQVPVICPLELEAEGGDGAGKAELKADVLRQGAGPEAVTGGEH